MYINKIILLLCLLFSAFADAQEGKKPLVLVSLAPYKFLVEKIAGDSVEVLLMVPAGANAHTYEPTIKQVLHSSQALIWFRLGESFERRAIPVIQGANPSLLLVDLRKGIDLLGGSCCCCSHQDSADLHIWLSARLAHIQAEAIAAGLIEVFPEQAALYRTNLKQLQNELLALDEEIKEILKEPKNRHILVSHPSFAYFCKDYGLEQFSVEFEGKDPTPRQLTKTLQLAREYKIDTIFVQRQFSDKGAKIVAEQIGAKIVQIDPYSEDYMTMMRTIARLFAGT